MPEVEPTKVPSLIDLTREEVERIRGWGDLAWLQHDHPAVRLEPWWQPEDAALLIKLNRWLERQ